MKLESVCWKIKIILIRLIQVTVLRVDFTPSTSNVHFDLRRVQLLAPKSINVLVSGAVMPEAASLIIPHGQMEQSVAVESGATREPVSPFLTRLKKLMGNGGPGAPGVSALRTAVKAGKSQNGSAINQSMYIRKHKQNQSI